MSAVLKPKQPNAVIPHSSTQKAEHKLPAFGVATILDRAKLVSEAFGPNRGFVLMMTAILATTGVSATTLFFIVQMVERVLR